jgi:hypothetical protein
MILDKNARLDAGAAQDFSGAGAVTTDAYDLGRVNQRIGSGERMSLIFVVTTKAAGDSGSFTDTFDFSVVSATAADLTTGQKVLETRRIPGADLVVGKLVEVPIPVGVPLQRYLGGKVAVGSWRHGELRELHRAVHARPGLLRLREGLLGLVNQRAGRWAENIHQRPARLTS